MAMAVEIERKFLVKDTLWKISAVKHKHITQWYLSNNGNIVRVRIVDDNAFITVKSLDKGISRLEFEYSIPLNDAKSLRLLSISPIIEKDRYVIPYKGRIWEVDEFKGDNDGLVMAEVELTDERDHIDLPEWVGDEVTDDERFRNAHLSMTPFIQWKNELIKTNKI